MAQQRLLDAELIPALVRLAGAERHAGAYSTVVVVVGILAMLSQETRFARRLVDGGCHTVLLQIGAPLHPDQPEESKQAQLLALTCVGNLAGRTSEFKQLLSADPDFFPLLFRLRDSSAAGITEHAHSIASHWGDEFFGWAWECWCGALARCMRSPCLAIVTCRPPLPFHLLCTPCRQPRHQSS